MFAPPENTMFIDAKMSSVFTLRECVFYRSEAIKLEKGSLLPPTRVCGHSANCFKSYENKIMDYNTYHKALKINNISELFPKLTERVYDFRSDRCGLVIPSEFSKTFLIQDEKRGDKGYFYFLFDCITFRKLNIILNSYQTTEIYILKNSITPTISFLATSCRKKGVASSPNRVFKIAKTKVENEHKEV